MTVPKEMMIIIYVMNMMIMMNKVMPTMIKILHLAVAIAFALYLMLELAPGWNEKKMKMIKDSMMAKLRRSRMDEVSVFPLNQLESALNQQESATPHCSLVSLAVNPQSTTEQI